MIEEDCQELFFSSIVPCNYSLSEWVRAINFTDKDIKLMTARTPRILLPLFILSFLLNGCGGGGSGSGNNSFLITGQVLNQSFVPLALLQLSIFETGDTTETDSNGNFALETIHLPSYTILVESEENAASLTIPDVPGNARQAIVSLEYNDMDATVRPRDIRFIQDVLANPATPTPTPSLMEEPESFPSPTETPSDDPTPESSPSPTPTVDESSPTPSPAPEEMAESELDEGEILQVEETLS